jgi:hypothetical protein
MTVRKPVDSTAAKGPHNLNHEPERKPRNQRISAEASEAQKPTRAAVRVGTTQMGFVLPHLRTTVLCTSILSIPYK